MDIFENFPCVFMQFQNAKYKRLHWIFQYQRVPSYYKENPSEIQAIASTISSDQPKSENQEKVQDGENQSTEQTTTSQGEKTEEKKEEEGSKETTNTSEQAPSQTENNEVPVTATS